MELTVRGDIHPYYGAEGHGEYGRVEYDSLDELIQTAADYDEDMNFVYRWDWSVPNPNDYDEDDPMPEQETLTLFVILQRKSRIVNWTCPVTEADEPRVREFLASDRILGALRRTWAPLLDEETAK